MTAAVSAMLLGLLPLPSASGQVLFSDDFNAFDPVVWGPLPPSTPNYLGVPQVTLATTFQGRTVLELQSTMTDHEVRGYRTLSAPFPLTTAHLAVDFYTMGYPCSSCSPGGCPSIDNLLRVELYDPSSGGSVGMNVFGGCLGNDRLVKSSTSQSGISSTPWIPIWDYGRWYRYVIDADQDRIRTSLRDVNGIEVWGHTYNIGLPALGTSFELRMTQGMGIPGTTETAQVRVDRIVLWSAPAVVSSNSPVPAGGTLNLSVLSTPASPVFVLADLATGSVPLGSCGATQLPFPPLLVLADPTGLLGASIAPPVTDAAGLWSAVVPIPTTISGLTAYVEPTFRIIQRPFLVDFLGADVAPSA